MAATYTVQFSAEFVAAFKNTPLSFNAFIAVLNSSPLLKSILQTSKFSVVLGNPLDPKQKKGTYTEGFGDSAKITVDPADIAKYATPADATLLADRLAHEFGHALLTPTADTIIGSAANPDAAKQIGMRQEGSALILEYIAAKQ